MNKTATLGGGGGSNMQHIATLRQTLQQALQQNNILRGKLQKIQMDADISDLPQVVIFSDIRLYSNPSPNMIFVVRKKIKLAFYCMIKSCYARLYIRKICMPKKSC